MIVFSFYLRSTRTSAFLIFQMVRDGTSRIVGIFFSVRFQDFFSERFPQLQLLKNPDPNTKKCNKNQEKTLVLSQPQAVLYVL
jgi:hypothetical protein